MDDGYYKKWAQRRAEGMATYVGPTNPDPYVGIPEVIELTESQFNAFIKSKDATMVFFYKEPSNDKSELAKSSFIEAARNTKRENHAYGAVNCTADSELCFKQKIFVFSPPMFRLYAGGHVVNQFPHDLTSKDISKFVEKAPMPVPERIFKAMCSCIGCKDG